MRAATAAGDGCVAPGRPAGPSAVLHVRHRPPLRARQRGRADRRDGRLRDVGHARRRRQQRRAASATPGPATATPPGRPAGATRRPAGGRAWSARASRSTPTGGSSSARTCSAAARASTGPASPHPDDGTPYGSRFPVITIRDMVRAQARLADHLGIEPWHAGDRRVDGRDAGRSSGRSCTPTGCARSCPSPRACRRRRSRSRGARSAGGRSRSIRAGAAATTTTPTPGDGPGGGPGDRPHGRPGDVPQRQRVHRPVRP